MKLGTRVRMTEAYKKALMKECTFDKHVGPFDPDDDSDCWGCSAAHVKEFGDSIGTVLEAVVWNSGMPDECIGPHVKVCWEPDMLRYTYHPNELEVIEV